MDLKIQAKDTKKFYNDIIKELMPASSKITIGVIDRPHFIRPEEAKSEHSKGIKGVSALSTAEVARAHEFGIGTPRRSFIRDTMKEWLMYDATKMSEKQYKRVDFYLKALSKQIYDRVQEAFDTNGWGKWKGLSEAYKERTGRTDTNILTDTGQLRGAIYVEYEGVTHSGKGISGIGARAKRADYGVSRGLRKKREKEYLSIYARSLWQSFHGSK